MAAINDVVRACLPETGPLRSYVEWASGLGHNPPEMDLAAAKVLMSWELCRRGFTVPYFGIPPHLWIAIVAGSGVSKTTTVTRAQRFCKAWQARCWGDIEHTDPWISLEGSMPGVIHVLSELKEVNGRRTGILTHPEVDLPLRREDMAALLNMAYDGEITRNLRYYQKQHDQDGAPPPILENGAFAALVTTTPIALERAVRPEQIEGGLFYRFSWLRVRLRTFKPLPTSDEVGRQHALETWTRWWTTMNGVRTRSGRPRTVFTEEAARHFAWFGEHHVGPRVLGEGQHAGMWARVLPKTAQDALILASDQQRFDGDGVLHVTLPDVERAISWQLFQAASGEVIGDETRAATRSHREVRAAILSAAFEAAGREGPPFVRGLSKRDIYGIFNGHIRKPLLDEVLDQMLESDELDLVHNIPTGGRSTSRYFVPPRGAEALEAVNAYRASLR